MSYDVAQMKRAIATETFQPSKANSKRLAKLKKVRGKMSQAINAALDRYFANPQPFSSDAARVA